MNLHEFFKPGKYPFPSAARASTIRRNLYVERSRLRSMEPNADITLRAMDLVFAVEGTTLVVREKGLPNDIARALANRSAA